MANASYMYKRTLVISFIKQLKFFLFSAIEIYHTWNNVLSIISMWTSIGQHHVCKCWDRSLEICCEPWKLPKYRLVPPFPIIII